MNQLAKQENFEAFTVQDALAIVLRYWKIATAVFGAVFIPAVLVAFLMPPLYESFATIIINRDKSANDFSMKAAQPDQSTVYRNLERKAEIRTYAEQMTSSEVLDTVRQNLQLNSEMMDYIHDARRYVRLIYKGVLRSFSFVYSEVKYLIGLSRRPTAEEENFLNYQDLMNDIRNRVKAVPQEDSNVIRLSFQSSDPVVAMNVANAITEQFLEAHSRKQNAAATAFFKDRASELEKELIEAEQQLASARSETALYAVEEQRQLLISKLTESQARIKQLQIESTSAESILEDVEQRLSNEPETVVTTAETVRNPVVQSLEQRLADASTELSIKRKEYNPGSPPLVRLVTEIDEIKSQLEKTEKDRLLGGTTRETNPIYRDLTKIRMEQQLRLVSINSELKGLERSLDLYSEELDQIGTQGNRLGVLGRKVASLKEDLLLHQRNREQARLAENLSTMRLAKIVISDGAFFPTRAVKPRKKLYLILGFAAALGLALLTPFLIYFNDRTVRDDKDVEDIVGASFISRIPHLGL